MAWQWAADSQTKAAYFVARAACI